jgi:hypothetical protein
VEASSVQKFQVRISNPESAKTHSAFHLVVKVESSFEEFNEHSNVDDLAATPAPDFTGAPFRSIFAPVKN